MASHEANREASTTNAARMRPYSGGDHEDFRQMARRDTHPSRSPYGPCGALTLALSTPALGQTRVPPVAETVSLSGPRFGATFLSDGIVRKIQDNYIEVGSLITQFGLAVREAVLQPGERCHGRHRMGGVGRRT